MRQGSAPNFCPPVQEGSVFGFQDESGDITDLEFLGLLIVDNRRYGFFFPIEEDLPAGSSGEIIILEVLDLDEEGQPSAFEIVEDYDFALTIFEEFKRATKDIYEFE